MKRLYAILTACSLLIPAWALGQSAGNQQGGVGVSSTGLGTDNCVVIADANGDIECSANMTDDGTNLDLGGLEVIDSSNGKIQLSASDGSVLIQVDETADGANLRLHDASGTTKGRLRWFDSNTAMHLDSVGDIEWDPGDDGADVAWQDDGAGSGPILNLSDGLGFRWDLASDGAADATWTESGTDGVQLATGGGFFLDHNDAGSVHMSVQNVATSETRWRLNSDSGGNRLRIETINSPSGTKIQADAGVLQFVDSGTQLVAAINDTGDEFDVVGQLNINSGAAITETVRGTNTTDVASISDQTQATVSVTVTGAAQGDECMVGTSADPGALGVSCRITAANTCTVTLVNNSGGAVDPGSLTYSCRTLAP